MRLREGWVKRRNLAALLLLAGCATNPATGERQISLVSESQEIQIGRESDPAITAQMGGEYDDAALRSYVNSLGQRLAASSERPNLPWSFKLLDDDLVNAFALPGGFIYVTRGILANMNSEAELAAVLGHEIGHVTARHSANQITRAQLATLGLGLGMILSETVREYGQAAMVGLQLLFLKYGRDDERQADALGFRYMTRLQYHPHGMTEVMQMLDNTSPAGEEGGVPNWLSTHPDPGDRVQANERRIQEANTDFSGYRIEEESFLQRLDGLVFGPDPRNGYFIDTRFLHPTLRFQLTFPSGWRTQNAAQQVQAVSANNDAAMSLTLSQASSAAEAARSVTTMEGLTVVRTWADRINGLNANLVEFDLTTQDGVLHGIAMYVEHDSRVYEILGYAPQARWSSNRSVVEAGLRSFGPLTDSRYLNVSPNRIEIIRLPRAMTVAEFMRQYPSTVPDEQVLIANHVSANDNLPAGRLMKQITGGRVPTS